MAGLGAGAGLAKGRLATAEVALKSRQLNIEAANASRRHQAEMERLRQSEIQHRDEMQLRREAERARIAQRNRELENASAGNEWDDAIRSQQYDMNKARLAEMQERIKNLRMVGEEETRQAENRRKMAENSLGVGFVTAMQQGGFLKNSQVEAFNKENGTKYTHVGIVNPITMRRYDDGGFHFVTIGKDNSGQQVLTDDLPLSSDFMSMVNDFYFGRKSSGGNGGSGVEIAKINALSREKVAGMQTSSRERIAAGKNDTQMQIAELKAALAERGFDIDEAKLAEMIRHNNKQETLRGRAIDERSRHNVVTEKQGQARIDETAAHHAATEQLGRDKLEHNRNRLENDKYQKEEERKMRLKLAEIYALARRNAGRSSNNQSDPLLTEIQQIQKTIDGGNLTPENRDMFRRRINNIAAKLGLQTDKGTIKSSDNSGDETANQEPPNDEYTKVKDGKSYHWGKSKNSGQWGYFPDKK